MGGGRWVNDGKLRLLTFPPTRQASTKTQLPTIPPTSRKSSVFQTSRESSNNRRKATASGPSFRWLKSCHSEVTCSVIHGQRHDLPCSRHTSARFAEDGGCGSRRSRYAQTSGQRLPTNKRYFTRVQEVPNFVCYGFDTSGFHCERSSDTLRAACARRVTALLKSSECFTRTVSIPRKSSTPWFRHTSWISLLCLGDRRCWLMDCIRSQRRVSPSPLACSPRPLA